MTNGDMKFKSILELSHNTRDLGCQLVEQAEGMHADLGVLFASHHHGPDFEELLHTLNEKLNVRNLIGCTGESIIGPDREIEGQPAVVLWLASLPGVKVLPFVVDQEDLETLDSIDAWSDRVGTQPKENPSLVLLAEPFSFDIVTSLSFLDQVYPAASKVGGMASGANQRGQNRLFLNDQSLRQGMVGVALTGPIQINTVVSQGCRPIGKPLVVTKSKQNVIEEIGGHQAYEALKQTFVEAPQSDQQLMQEGLHVGVVIDEHLKQLKPGDFLVHNLLGVYDENKLAISNIVRPGQTIQFHVRDASTADSEMRTMLADTRERMTVTPQGGLLFSCNGRGRRLFGKPNHDIALVNENFQNCAVAGFFAQGEIGPVGGKTFVHGFTSSLILFR